MSYFKEEVNDFYLDISKGNVVGHKAITKFGRNPTISVGSFSAIWNGGGAYTGFNATAAETVSIVSSSSSDVDGGVGARTITLYGLDSNLLEQTEVITLTGLTPVVSTLLYKRLDRIKVTTAGSLGYNAGSLTVRQTTTVANIFAVLPATYNSTMICAYTIPSNMTGYLISSTMALASKTAAAADARIRVRPIGGVFSVGGEASLNSTGAGFITLGVKIPQKIPSGSDIFIEADGSAAVAITAFMDIILVEN